MKNISDVKFNVTFWQLFTVIMVAAILGGIIYKFAYDNKVQDDLDSISYPSAHKEPIKSTPAK